MFCCFIVNACPEDLLSLVCSGWSDVSTPCTFPVCGFGSLVTSVDVGSGIELPFEPCSCDCKDASPPFSLGGGCSTPGSVVDVDLTTAADDWTSPRTGSLFCDGKDPGSSVLGSGRPRGSSTNKY